MPEIEKPKQVGIAYGIISDTLIVQLKKQKIKFNQSTIKTFQKEIECLHTLRFGNNILNDSDFEKLLKKLHKKLMSHLKQSNQ